MRARSRIGWGRIALCAALLGFAGRAEAQQSLGHKVLGTLGLDAGIQPEPGIYLAARSVWFSSDRVVDRRGDGLPIALDLDAFAEGLGVAGTWRVPRIATYFSTAVAAPIARVRANSDRAEASIDKFGLGDLYAQPVRLGWRPGGFDIVTGYAFYAPTGAFEPGGTDGVGQGQWSHEFSLGGAARFDDRTGVLTALASYQLNGRKSEIDLTRGDTLQLQGGAGKSLGGIVQLGAVGYALWQVRDDRGAALPAVLRGARDLVVGLGGEANVSVRAIRSRVTVRYMQDVVVRSRPVGRVLVVGIQGVVWRPRPR
jgi:hypothetical protein